MWGSVTGDNQVHCGRTIKSLNWPSTGWRGISAGPEFWVTEEGIGTSPASKPSSNTRPKANEREKINGQSTLLQAIRQQ